MNLSPLNIIIIVSIFQILVNIYGGIKHFKWLTVVVLLAILINYFFILPSFFYPKNVTGEEYCNTPMLGIYFAFWILGPGSTIIIHFLMFLIIFIINKIKK